jgi:transcriptional regulator with XRE-family HTH domain
MINSIQALGQLIKTHREAAGISQDSLAERIEVRHGMNRSVVAHLEQGLRLPKPEALEAICGALNIPKPLWAPFTASESQARFGFEELLSELIGKPVTIEGHEAKLVEVVENHVEALFSSSVSEAQTRDRVNCLLVYYGIAPCSTEFVAKYLPPTAFSSLKSFEQAVRAYQKDAIRLFSSFDRAFEELNREKAITGSLSALLPRSLAAFHQRSDWAVIQDIPNDRLPDLGYISAARVRQESSERRSLQRFLEDLASSIEKGGKAEVEIVSSKMRRRMDSLLRKFETKLGHGLFSPLFTPDPDELRREAFRLAPKSDDELARMNETQTIALGNLANYIAADHMDVYVATSMRSDADFVSVNHFVKTLFSHDKVRPIKLRYFNPTQSWIDDRIAKGLVEAIMLKRSQVTIYMAQKADTFGKDSEASVALGQGKPVIVYVPRLYGHDGSIDSEVLFRRSRTELIGLLPENERVDVDDTVDNQSLVARILEVKLSGLADHAIESIVAQVWADFDLQSETERLKTDEEKGRYRGWLDSAVKGTSKAGIPKEIRENVIGILVSNAVRFEGRAKLFREIHPLALQVILSSGVLNGILVVRSVDQCAEILDGIIKNQLELSLDKDDQNYRLLEQKTGSTIRVISRHKLLGYGFRTFYNDRG